MTKRNGAPTRPRTMAELLGSAGSHGSHTSSSSSVAAVGIMPLTAPQPAPPPTLHANASSQPAPPPTVLPDASSQPAQPLTLLPDATPQLGPLATIAETKAPLKKRKVGAGRPRKISDFLQPTSERSSQLSGSSPPASGVGTLHLTEPTPNAASTLLVVVPSTPQPDVAHPHRHHWRQML